MIIKNAYDERSKRLLLKYLLGGTAAGTSAALATSLINHYQTLASENAALKSTSSDDDTLFITLRNQNAPGVNVGTEGKKKEEQNDDAAKWASSDKQAFIGGGVALSGGALAALGSYALVRKLYQEQKKKREQKKLDEAQQLFYDTMSQAAAVEKRSSQQNPEGKPMSFTEWATSTPVALTLLAAIASGALTSRALDKTFPKPKLNSQVGPKKIVLRRESDPSYYETIRPEEEEEEKEASYDSRNEQDIFDDGLELLVHMCLGNEKVASISDLHTIVGAVIGGRKNELVNNICEFGIKTAMDLSKGDYENVKKASPQEVALAVGQCVKTPELNPVVAVLASGEYEEMAPHFCKAAMSQPEHVIDRLCKIAGVLGAFGRHQVFANSTITFKKTAAAIGLEDLLSIIMAEQNAAQQQGIDEGDDPRDQTLLSTDSESSEEVADKNKSEDEGKLKIVNKLNRNKNQLEAEPEDEIDQVMAGGMA